MWVHAKQLAVYTYSSIIPLLPPDEKWGFSIQIKRSVSSISANIAEGYGRFYFQDNIHFCYNARGSLEETISHIILASEIGYIPLNIKQDFLMMADNLVKLINGYIAYLRKSKKEVQEPAASYELRNDDSMEYDDVIVKSD